jgi:hypothetical protein
VATNPIGAPHETQNTAPDSFEVWQDGHTIGVSKGTGSLFEGAFTVPNVEVTRANEGATPAPQEA